MSHVQELIPPRPAPVATDKPLNISRVVGIAVITLWLLLAAGLIFAMIEGWDWAKFERYGPRYIDGLITTITLVGSSIILGALLSVPIAFARMSENRVISALAYAYVYVFAAPAAGAAFPDLLRSRQFPSGAGNRWPVVVLPRGLVLRPLVAHPQHRRLSGRNSEGAIRSVPRGQIEGAASLGLSKFITFRKVILPQALIVALRPYGNEIILMIKGSAVVSIVTVFDLMGQTRYAFSRTFDYQAYLWAAIFYLTIVETLRHVWAWLEARLTRHLKR